MQPERQRRRHLHVHRAIAGAALFTLATGCAVNIVESGSSPSGEPTTDTARDVGPTTTLPLDAPTTNASPTTPAPTVTTPKETKPIETKPKETKPNPKPTGPTTPEVGGQSYCPTFKELPALERINAVADSDFPTDRACATPVEAAIAALKVYEATETLNNTDLSTVLTNLNCEEDRTTGQFTNVNDFPIVVWGAGIGADDDDNTLWFTPFVTEPIEAGDTVDFTIDRPDNGESHTSCNLRATAIVAPVGEFAPDGTIDTLADDDPQASDDIAVWFPALKKRQLELESDGFEGNQRSFNLTYVEDLHSLDVFSYPNGPGSDDDTADSYPFPNIDICEEITGLQMPDLDGEYTFATYQLSFADGSSLFGAILFRRGADNRWRYIGTGQVLVDNPSTPCPTLPH